MRYRNYNNDIHPAIPYIALYDEDGTQVINGSFLTWDSIKSKTSHFLYSADDDRVQLQLNSSGLYEVTFNVSLAGSDTCYFELYKNGTVISESRMFISPIMAGQTIYTQSGSIKYVVFLQKGDYIQVKGTGVIDGASTIANTSRLIIKFLPMHGWDNSAGGRLDYKGGVER